MFWHGIVVLQNRGLIALIHPKVLRVFILHVPMPGILRESCGRWIWELWESVALVLVSWWRLDGPGLWGVKSGKVLKHVVGSVVRVPVIVAHATEVYAHLEPGPDPSGKDRASVNDEAESVAETVCGPAQILGHHVVLGRPVVGGVTHTHALVEVQIHHPNNTLDFLVGLIDVGRL